MNDDLLTPSLARGSGVNKGLSTQAWFFTGFFGGPFIGLAFLGCHAFYLRRIRQDLPVLLVMFLATAVLVVLNSRGLLPGDPSLSRYVPRALALILVGLYWLLHRKSQKALESMDLIASPWKAVGISIVAGIGLTSAVKTVERLLL